MICTSLANLQVEKRTIAATIYEDQIPNARHLFLSQRDERRGLKGEGKD